MMCPILGIRRRFWTYYTPTASKPPFSSSVTVRKSIRGLYVVLSVKAYAIGNHSYTHPDFRKATPERFRNQITKTERILQASAGFRPKLIRPPYGEITEPQIKWARRHGYMIVNWNVDSLDWKGLSKTQIQRNVIPATGPGSIILMHAGGGQSSNLQGTIQALPGLIHSLKAKGYKFVTVPRLLHTSERK